MEEAAAAAAATAKKPAAVAAAAKKSKKKKPKLAAKKPKLAAKAAKTPVKKEPRPRRQPRGRVINLCSSSEEEEPSTKLAAKKPKLTAKKPKLTATKTAAKTCFACGPGSPALTPATTGTPYVGPWSAIGDAKIYCVRCWPARKAALLGALGKKTATKKSADDCCRCGSTYHHRPNHSSCPLNKRNLKPASAATAKKSLAATAKKPRAAATPKSRAPPSPCRSKLATGSVVSGVDPRTVGAGTRVTSNPSTPNVRPYTLCM